MLVAGKPAELNSSLVAMLATTVLSSQATESSSSEQPTSTSSVLTLDDFTTLSTDVQTT
jgi:hypothetical protein